jgi:hypothetical protein
MSKPDKVKRAPHPNGRKPPNPQHLNKRYDKAKPKRIKPHDPDASFKKWLILALAVMVIVGTIIGYSGQ